MEDETTPALEVAEEETVVPKEERRETIEIEHRSVEVRKDWLD